MRYNPEKHHRRSVRLQGYDYSQAGWYLVTICTRDRICLFGDVADNKVRLNELGSSAEACWKSIPEHFVNVGLDAFVVMPNHVHGIIGLVGATHASPLPMVPRGPKPRSIGAIVGSFKAALTRQFNKMAGGRTEGVWQRSYHEHIIRDEAALVRIRQYIADNPAKWTGNPDHFEAEESIQ